MADKVSPLVYLKKELDFQLSEYQSLSEKDKKELRQYAIEEMVALDIPQK